MITARRVQQTLPLAICRDVVLPFRLTGAAVVVIVFNDKILQSASKQCPLLVEARYGRYGRCLSRRLVFANLKLEPLSLAF